MALTPAKVLNIERAAKDVYLIVVKPMNRIGSVKPFNFFMVWIPRVDEIPLSAAYVEDDKIFFLFKVKGEGTRGLSRTTPGSFVGLKGPLGRGFLVNNELKKVLVVAGGIGIAPVPLFIKESKYKQIDVVWGVKSSGELFELDKYFPGIGGNYRLIIATEDCDYGVCGTALDALKRLDISSYDAILAIGPTPMLRSLCEHLKGVDIYVALENMVKCGIGLCGSCYVKYSTKLLCIEGPVFRCEEVVKHLRESADS